MRSIMKQPLFSIITVCYNAEDMIEQTIQSVLEQKCQDYEYIVVDGGSTDGTREILNKYENKLNKYISEPDEGIYDAMNKAARLANGRYIYYLNAGDWFYDKNVLKEVSTLIKKSKPELLLGYIKIIYQNYQVLKNTKISRMNLKLGKMPPHQGSFFKLRTLKKLKYFDTQYHSSADFDLMAKAIKQSVSVKHVDLIIANFSAGGTSSNKDLSYKETYKLINQHFGLFWGTLFKIKKIYFEQGIKNFLIRHNLNGVYNYLARLNNQR